MNVEVFCFDAGRSREGAWIEMKHISSTSQLSVVAPVRERGLKFLQ